MDIKAAFPNMAKQQQVIITKDQKMERALEWRGESIPMELMVDSIIKGYNIERSVVEAGAHSAHRYHWFCLQLNQLERIDV
jgi:hypothetical protein